MNERVKRSALLIYRGEKMYNTNRIDEWLQLRNEAESVLESEGYEYFDMGEYRVVYKPRDNNAPLLKIARGDEGTYENISEVGVWEGASENARTRLAEIIDFSDEGIWITQRFISGENEVSAEEARELRDFLKDHGVETEEVRDYNMRKNGSGTPILYDYAGY